MFDEITLKPVIKQVCANINLPGSKSIANRVLPLAATANHQLTISNIPVCAEDVRLMIAALLSLGVDIQKSSEDPSRFLIFGCNAKFPHKNISLHCGNSGTSIRFLAALLALTCPSGNYFRLTGIERMKERPIGNLVDALIQVGANVKYLENSGFPPLKIAGFKDNKVDRISINGNISSQFLSAMLIALPQLKRKIEVEVAGGLISKPYVLMTVELIKRFGYSIDYIGSTFCISGEYQPVLNQYTIEPDASSASYFLAIGALKGEVTINNLGYLSLQGDKNFAQVLEKMGASIRYLENTITVSQGALHGININMEDMPDVAMTLAVLALFAKGATTITGISSWKVKETDRLRAMHDELVKFGAIVAITDDSICITSSNTLVANVRVKTYNDHRMAMAFSLIAVAGVTVIIEDYQCVGKTFANYFDVFNQVCYS